MKLSPLEEDILGDLAEDRHGLWEIFEFARLHHPDAGPGEIAGIGSRLLAVWLARGWLVAETEDGALLPLNVIEDALNSQLQAHAIGPVPGAPWLALAPQASVDVPWLPPVT